MSPSWQPTPDTYVGVVGSVITLIGLGVSIWTLSRVRRVEQAQNEATAATQELLNVDQLEVDLVRVMARLRASGDPESIALGTELGVSLGSIQGVRRALTKTEARASKRHVRVATIDVKNGFFGEDLVSGNIRGSTERIDVITGRLKLVAGFYVMDALRQACEKGVTVRILGISDASQEDTLRDAVRTVSNPAPKDADDYRRQIQENKAEILASVSCWNEGAREHFQYRLSRTVPRVSMARFDNVVDFGFLQLYRDAQPLELRDRQYLEIPISLPLGRAMLKHFDLVWDEADVVLPVELAAAPDVSPECAGESAP